LSSTHLGMPASEIWVILMALTVNAGLKAWIAEIAGGEGHFSSTMQRYILLSCVALWALALLTGTLFA
jgi:hypothetical protein